MNAPTPTSIRRSLVAILALAVLAPATPVVAKEPGGAPAPSPAALGGAEAIPLLPADAPPPPPGQSAPPPAPITPPPVVAPVPPPAAPVPDVTPPPTPDDVFSGRPVPEDGNSVRQENSWFDSSHAYVGRMFFSPAIRLDKFFSDETDLDPERARSFARLRTGVRLRQDGKPQYTIDLFANIKFPGFNRWLDRARLVLSGESEANEDALSPNGTVSPFTSRQRNGSDLELRYFAYRGIRASVDLGAGLLVRLPIGAFGRVRYRMAVPIDEAMVSRFSTQAFYRTDMHFGTRASSEVDWPFERSSMLRLGVAGQMAQKKVRGLEYGTELVASHAFTPTFAVALGADAQGSTKDPILFTKYRVYTRLRHDVFRRWLFLEAEPEVGWPWTPSRGRYRAYAVLLRLEVQFEGAGAVEAETQPPLPAG